MYFQILIYLHIEKTDLYYVDPIWIANEEGSDFFFV